MSYKLDMTIAVGIISSDAVLAITNAAIIDMRSKSLNNRINAKKNNTKAMLSTNFINGIISFPNTVLHCVFKMYSPR